MLFLRIFIASFELLLLFGILEDNKVNARIGDRTDIKLYNSTKNPFYCKESCFKHEFYSIYYKSIMILFYQIYFCQKFPHRKAHLSQIYLDFAAYWS